MQASLDAVASPRRRAILRLVWERELSAGEIAAQFDVSWPATSQNLRVLCDAGLLTQRKAGHHPREKRRQQDPHESLPA